MTWLIVAVVSILVLALFIDWTRKRINNNPHKPITPNAKPGEDTNHTMGDNRYSGGGQ
ncbi:hypothetical protein JOC77_001637 [Peribacillus deserti]|uniref:YtzI protein n=1 Tax=Peribacillus deserti TaxID=673318 RepID=A0ABS2QGB6_9BACI|nr:hypothetical protein [Peribacillus deserti]MBM7692210.1 hypothetical protein [Peribacillus deserti]